MRFRYRHVTSVAGMLLLLAMGWCLAAAVPGQPPAPFATQELTVPPAQGGESTLQVLVQLTDPPAVKAYAAALENRKKDDLQARIDARLASRLQFQANVAAQARFMSTLKASGVQAAELYRVRNVLNGVAMIVDRGRLEELRRMPGVRKVTVLEPEYPTNASSVPFLGVPKLWENSLGLAMKAAGEGIRIGIIDTGIDYQHADFGGTGLLADYQANNRAVITDGYFPTAKVVGGWDFAGDAYTGGNTPVPDPDPMDCNGHGTHVAGTAAGLGVNADGTTYGGPYDSTAGFGSLRIGPGIAPKALLYALRVFGCTGSTTLTVQAIDWAVDPNGDGDPSDHLDVINMSLGSNFGSPSDSTTMAAENAALMGVVVVCSAGNAGDTYFITGSPGASGRAIATAASIDSRYASVILAVDSPSAIAGKYAASGNTFLPLPAPLPNGLTGQVVQALDAADASGPNTTDGCTALTNGAALAGNIALIDRGTCGFQVKAVNAQAAGAIAVIIGGIVPGDPTLTTMGGAAGLAQITIPTIFVSKDTRDAIVAHLGDAGGVTVTLNTSNSGDTLASFSSRGPRRGSTPLALKPDIAAPGQAITSAQTGVTCTSGACQTPNGSGYVADNQALVLSGTSMACPHMTGVMALLKQLHPTWTVEELKALAMNGAQHDVTLGAEGGKPLYGPGRIGAGRVDPVLSAKAEVVAFDAGNEGLVSLSFGSVAASESGTQATKFVRLVNYGETAQTFDLAIDTKLDVPGVAFTLPEAQVTVPAFGSVTFPVQLDAVVDQMKHVREATVPPTQAAPSPLTSLGSLSRHWLTEEAGYVTLSQGGACQLRVPVYAAPRPASRMVATGSIATGGVATGDTTLPLAGTGVSPSGSFTPPTDVLSLVTPFELQVVSPRDPSIPDFADIQYVGVAYDPASNLIMFGVTTWGDWTTPYDVAFNIYIDSTGTWNRILFNSDPGNMSRGLFGTTATGQDSFLTAYFNLATNGVGTAQYVNRYSAAAVDTALFNSNVMILAASPAQLGLAAGTTSFRYKVETCWGSSPIATRLGAAYRWDSAAGPYTWNYASQGLNFGGACMATDLDGESLNIHWDTARLTATGSLGALLLHHHNKPGERAQVVPLDTASACDLAVHLKASTLSPQPGGEVVLTLTVTNNGPAVATGGQAVLQLPAGLSYVSDDGEGAYNSGTGVLTLPPLDSARFTILSVRAKVAGVSGILVTAQATATSPLDAVATNNQASLLLKPAWSPFRSISGHAGAPWATLTYTDRVVKVVTADETGAYTLQVSDDWSGTVTPSKPGWAFAPPNRGYSNVTEDRTGEDFSARNLSSVTMTSSLNPSAYAQLVTFTASVSSAAGTPTGSVTFYDSGDRLGNCTLTGGVATFATKALAVGSHSILAVYSGDSTFGGGASALVSQVVSRNPVTLALASSLNPAPPAGAITLSATIVSEAGREATGTVDFFDGTTLLGRSRLDGGVATLTTSALVTLGVHPITAVYAGDASFTGATSPALSQTISRLAASLALSSSPNPSLAGAAVTFSARMTVGSGALPSGSVDFYEGTVLLGTQPLVSGVATFSTTGLAVGTHAIHATFPGSSSFDSVTSNTLSQVVSRLATTTSLLRTGGTHFGELQTLTATVTSPSGTPTGTVAFMDGSTLLGSATLSGGSAVFTTTGLSLGSHTLSASYAGDGTCAESVSAPVALVLTGPALVLTGPTAPLTVRVGGTASTTFTVASLGTVSAPVTFSASGLPSGATLTFSSDSVNIQQLPATITVTIRTASARLHGHLTGTSTPATGLGAGGLLVAGIFLLPASRRRRKLFGLMLPMLALVLLGGFMACTSSDKTATAPSSGNPTPAGTYTVTITATCQGATAATSTLTLTVAP